MNHPCPQCGYCPTCGRSDAPKVPSIGFPGFQVLKPISDHKTTPNMPEWIEELMKRVQDLEEMTYDETDD